MLFTCNYRTGSLQWENSNLIVILNIPARKGKPQGIPRNQSVIKYGIRYPKFQDGDKT